MNDLDKAMAVMDAAFDPHWREAWTRRQVEDSLALSSGFLILFDEAGRYPDEHSPAAGFVLARKVLDEVELLLIGVLPEKRGHGLGSKLIAEFLQKSARMGATNVFLEVRANNPAEKVYRSAGFVPIGRRKDYYRTEDGTKIDAVTFGKAL
ncbi:GNAT family N-acetyltransferase [Erythrobacter aquimaris]|uniref:GNAT family N-acetyltransferase n=1 Tax=Qipengyuania aquimaris TaxID=255984 RepID=A0A6I4TL21_9SPHN|nr:GNAT family N-acetyltransferase [Qipengyuania aquimaris]MXO95268.1 GNAT family N-acetyltransferase [Qipengyuania aquimaris]